MDVERKKEYVERMKAARAKAEFDPEVAHCDSDAIFHEVVMELGFPELVDAANVGVYWYA